MIRPQIYTFSLVTTQTTTRGLCALARNGDSKTKKFLLATVDWYIEPLPARLPKLPEPSCNMALLPLPRIIAKENNGIRYFTYTVLWMKHANKLTRKNRIVSIMSFITPIASISNPKIHIESSLDLFSSWSCSGYNFTTQSINFFQFLEHQMLPCWSSRIFFSFGSKHRSQVR